MRRANQEFYAAAAHRLAQYAAGVSPEAVVSVADEILAIAGVLIRHPRLRRALAAQTRSVSDRTGLLRSLLAGQVGADALDLVSALLPGRWSRPGELLDAVEKLGVEALLVSGERAGDLATLEDELFRFGRIAAGDVRLATTLGDVAEPVARRAELARDLLSGKVLPLTSRLVEVALEGYGGRGFAGSLTRLVELVAERRERTIAYVTTAVALPSEQENRLCLALTEHYGRKVSLKTEVDPAIIGGVLVRVGADLYDGTVRRRLAVARAAMTR